MRCISALLVLFLGLALAQTTVSGTLGTAVAVTGGVDTTINFVGSTKLVIKTDIDTQVTFSLVVSTSFTLDPSLSQYTLGSLASAATSIGYSLALSNNAVIQSATVTSDTLGTSFLAALTGNVGGILYYNAQAQGYLEIPPSTTLTTMTFSAPYKGSYVFTYRASTQPAAALFNQAVQIAAGVSSKIQLHSATTSKLVITQSTTASSSFTATESSTAPSGSNLNGLVKVSSYFDLQSTVSSGIQSNLEYTYTSAQVAAGDANRLAWYYYNTASGEWDLDGSSSVDVNARVVTHASSHFSSWMVAYSSFSPVVLPAALLIALALISALLM